MGMESVEVDYIPKLNNPLFIAGFEGWGNALDISSGMAEYLIRKLEAQPFGRIDPDRFYRFDESRPTVDIEDGLLRKVSPPGGEFYATRPGFTERDVIIFKAVEPSARWYHFVENILSVCHKTGVNNIISLGSMYDNVLHTETVVSALASSKETLKKLKTRKVTSINYKGPSAIHTILQNEAQKRGFECMSLWCHCPYYLQGTKHFGLLSHLASLLSFWGGFQLDTSELETTWRELSKQIKEIIDKNPEVQGMINDLRKAKLKLSMDAVKKADKIIHLDDVLKTR
jgi:proteasome assembly chaperone (PAC2) family protein